ncbi:MAG: hypothetical protein CMB72_03480 [Euryarchaeota archaeon]|nr:hypothetical protein [Euryarchaeota archaeon]
MEVMSSESVRFRFGFIAVLLVLSGLAIIDPVEPSLSTSLMFEDEAVQRVENERANLHYSDLVVRITHDDGAQLSSNLTRVQELISIENDLLNDPSSDFAWKSSEVWIVNLYSPYSSWSDAFNDSGRNLENATRWGEILQPEIEGGWCSENSTNNEMQAFQDSLMLLPSDSRVNVACPSLPGSSVILPPESNEILWVIHLESHTQPTDWAPLFEWAENASESSDYQFSTAGVNLLFGIAKDTAEKDLTAVMLPAFILLLVLLWFGLRDIVIASATLAGVGVVMLSTVSLLTLAGHQFSIIDGIALPIVMGVAVDGAFWYCRSSRTRDEVRKMLFVAMMTTIAAVMLAIISPILVQKSLGLVMATGILLSWAVSRFILEDLFLSRRDTTHEDRLDLPIRIPESIEQNSWSAMLVFFAILVLVSPGGVAIMNVESFLPENTPELEEIEDLESRYILASSTTMYVTIDVDGDDSDKFQDVLDFQKRISLHPSAISLDTGMIRQPLVTGIPLNLNSSFDTIDSRFNEAIEADEATDQRLIRGGETKGVAIQIQIDSRDSNGALAFGEDTRELMNAYNLTGEIGGDLLTGAKVAKTFEESRIVQILLAGVMVLIVSSMVLKSFPKGLRIAVGAVAVGAAVDAMAGYMTGRGMETAPAVLLGMGFAADYLSHASADHPPTRRDNSARWLAGMTSLSGFVLVGFAAFPPARNMGQLLTASILLSVILATSLSFKNSTEVSKGPSSRFPRINEEE